MLRKEIQKKSKIIYVRVHPRDPKKVSSLIKKHLEDALTRLAVPGKVTISFDGLKFELP